MKMIELKNMELHELINEQAKEVNGGTSLYDQIMFLFNSTPWGMNSFWVPCGENGYTAWCGYYYR